MTPNYLANNKPPASDAITYRDSSGSLIPVSLAEPSQSREDLEFEVRSLRLINEIQRNELQQLRAKLAALS